MKKIKFTQMELEVIDYAVELAWSDRKPKYQKAIDRVQRKILMTLKNSGLTRQYNDIDESPYRASGFSIL